MRWKYTAFPYLINNYHVPASPSHLKSRKVSPPNSPSKPIKSEQGPRSKAHLLTPIHAPPQVHCNQVAHEHITVPARSTIEHGGISEVGEIAQVMVREGIVNGVIDVSLVDIIVVEGFRYLG